MGGRARAYVSGPRLSVRAAAAEVPDRVALIASGRAYTYGELDELAGVAAVRLGANLAEARAASEEQGSAAGSSVAVVAHRAPEVVCVLLALFELGVPVALIHDRLTDRERAALLRTFRPAFTVDRKEAGRLVSPGGGGESAALTVAECRPIDPEAILAIVPTSGSSGGAKGVLLSRRAFLASAAASASNLGWQAEDRWLIALPLAHVGGLSILVRTLIARSCSVLNSTRFDPRKTIDAMTRHGVTVLSLVPTMLSSLLDLRPAWRHPEGLRAVLLGGAPADAALLKRAADRGVPVLTTYGLTEACSQVTVQRYGTINRGELGAGSPLEGTELRVIDGEIQIRGPTLMSGYLTADGIRTGLDAEGWLSTGDEGELDDAGRLHVRGRLDRLIVTGGENVDPLEVEAALLACEPIREAVVFGVEDARWGQVVAAALVTEGRLDLESLTARLEERLAPHKRPRLIGLLDALPITRSGKPDRRAAEAKARTGLRPLSISG